MAIIFLFSTDVSDDFKDQYYNLFQKIKRTIQKEKQIWEKLDNDLKSSKRLLARYLHDHPDQIDDIRSCESYIAYIKRDMANRCRPLAPAWFFKKGEGLRIYDKNKKIFKLKKSGFSHF